MRTLSEPSNTPFERTIGVGILPKEKPRLPPFAAQRPCSTDNADHDPCPRWAASLAPRPMHSPACWLLCFLQAMKSV